MTTYNTYQEAKIANPSEDIYPHGERFTTIGRALITGTKCNPADHCMTVEKFLADGHKFVDGDLILNLNGNMNEIRGNEGLILSSEGVADFNCDRFILRAAALEKIPTETPEEKEVLDGIESAGEVEWDGEGLPPVGIECECLLDCSGKWRLCKVLFSSKESVVVVKLNSGAEVAIDPFSSSFRKPETTQQREDRERLEAAKDLYREYMKAWGNGPYISFESLDPKNTEAFLMLADKTNYRKEKTHGAN